MKICIDCRHINSSGVGVYLKGCLEYFINSNNTIILLGNEALIKSQIKYPDIDIIQCSVKPFSIQEMLFFPGEILGKINKFDIYYSPYFNIPNGIKIPVFTTIHDIVFPDMPELTSSIGLTARMFFYRRAAHRSKAIFTVSQFSKSRIEHYLGKKINVINASNAVKNPPFQEKTKNNKKKKILFIGNIKKHKGLNLLLNAFTKCQSEGLDYELVVVGVKDNFRSRDLETATRLNNLENRKIKFTGYISDEEKNRLLAEAALLVQPSLYEGFGYPPLEAMLSGTQVLISDIPVFKEVYDSFPVVFFKSGNTDDLKLKIMELLYNNEPKSLSLPPLLKEKYSFSKTVKIILNEFNKS